MRQYSSHDVNRHFSDVAHAASTSPVTITQHGKARYILMSVDHYAALQASGQRLDATPEAASSNHADLELALQGRIAVAGYIRDTARRHGVSYAPLATDTLAEAISRVSDAGHHPDEIEDLLLAITRQRLITPKDSILLLAQYLRQSADAA